MRNVDELLESLYRIHNPEKIEIGFDQPECTLLEIIEVIQHLKTENQKLFRVLGELFVQLRDEENKKVYV